MQSEACKILARTFNELAELFASGNGAAKHKVKAADKEDQRQAALVAQASTPSAMTAEPIKVSPTKEAGKKTPKDSKKKEKPVAVDSTGNELKRPLSAYMLYNNHRRPTLRIEHPELALPDLSKLIGDEWKKLSENQKAIWKEKAKESRLEYDIKSFNIKRKQDDGENAEGALPPTQKEEAETHKPVENGAKAEVTPKKAKLSKEDESLSPFSDEEDAKPVNHVSAANPKTKD